MLIVVGLTAWQGSALTFRRDLGDFFPDSGAGSGVLSARRPGPHAAGDRLAIVLDGADSIPDHEAIQLFARLGQGLTAIEGVRQVGAPGSQAEEQYLREHLPQRILLYLPPGALAAVGERLTSTAIRTALRPELDATGDRPVVATVAPASPDPLGVLRLALQPIRAWRGVSRLRPHDGLLALPGGRSVLLVVEPAGNLDDLDDARRLVVAIEQLLGEVRQESAMAPLLQGRQLYLIGEVASRVSVAGMLQSDGIRVAATAVVLTGLALGLFFRRIIAPLVILATVGAGLVLTAAIAAVSVGSVGILAWVFSGLLVGLGVDFGIHICAQYWLHAPAGLAKEPSLTASLERPGPGIVTGAVTSMAGFAALAWIPYPWTREVGLLTAIGLLAILASSFVLLPLLLSYAQPARRAVQSGLVAPFQLDAGWGSRPRWRVRAWTGVVAAAATVLPFIPRDANPWHLFVQGNRESARLDRLSAEAGTAFTPIVLRSRGATATEALALDREAVSRLQTGALRAGIAVIQSLAAWLPSPEVQRDNLQYLRDHPDRFDRERIRRDVAAAVAGLAAPDPSLLNSYLPNLLGALDPHLQPLTLEELRTLGLGEVIDRHLQSQDGGYVAVSQIYLRRLPWEDGVIARFTDAVHGAGLDTMPGVSLVGAPLRAPDGHTVRRAMATAAALAAALVLAVLALRLGSVRLALLCLVPVVCGVGLMLIAMWALDSTLTVMSAALVPILVGTGVDDGVHMVERFRAGQGIDDVVREAGAGMVMTSLTTAVTFACLTLAQFPGIRMLGVFGVVGTVGCLFSALHLVPIGWHILGRQRRHVVETPPLQD